MPDRLAQDLVLSIRKNQGKLAKKRRNRQFEKLTDKEVAEVEEIVNSAFAGFNDSERPH